MRCASCTVRPRVRNIFLEVGSVLLFLHDFVLAIFLLCFRKEDSFVLIIAIKGLRFVVEGFDLGLPFLGNLVELFAGTLVSGNVAHDIFHVDECKFLRMDADEAAEGDE